MTRPVRDHVGRLPATLLGAFLAGLAAGATLPAALGASPSPAIGDVRTAIAPGLVGDPVFAIAGVLVVGVVALGATLAWIRLTATRSRR